VIAGMCPAPDSIDDLDMLCAGGMPIPLPTVVANNLATGSASAGHPDLLVPEMVLTAVDLLHRSPSQPDMIRRWRRS